jgi:hypothetical protein
MVLHSCGNVEAVMKDLISFVGIDAKHSFEDAIEPVGSVKRRYGNRIGVVGGIDMDFLARQSVAEVATYTRRVLEECAPGGVAMPWDQAIPSPTTSPLQIISRCYTKVGPSVWFKVGPSLELELPLETRCGIRRVKRWRLQSNCLTWGRMCRSANC